MELINHAIAWASDTDIKKALGNTDEVLEWETVGYTFIKSAAACVIVRSGALGGDTHEVHGGWKFANFVKMEMAWQEIKLVAGCYNRKSPSRLLASAVMRTRR